MATVEALEAELAQLGYRELQAMAKEKGLKASGKAEELVQRLIEQEVGGEVPPSTVRRSGTAAKTPRTSRKAAATVDKAALLRAAASTPLPAANGREEEEEEEQPRTVRRRLSAQRQAAASPKSTRRGAAPRRAATAAGLATPTFWLLALTALAAGLAALAVPYCQQHDCAAAARRLPQQASDVSSELYAKALAHARAVRVPDAAAAAYAQARARALAAADAAQEQWRALVASLTSKGGRGGSGGCRFDAATALHSIMPVGEEFAALRQAAAAALSGGSGEARDKALAALFVCEVADDCHSALRLLDEAMAPQGGACVLHLDARHLGGDKGALQAQLAAFLHASPTGLVVLRRMDQLSPELLPVLINALSEHGAFQRDGEAVPTTRATFLLTSLMPSEVFMFVSEEIKFKQEAKTHLVVDLALRAEDKEAAKSQAIALRRRIDFVIPIGSDPSSAGDGDAQADPAAAPAEVELPVEGCSLDASQLMHWLLPDGEEWDPLRASAAATLQQHGTNKPAVALFACESEGSCKLVATEAVRAAGGAAGCVLALESSQLSSKAALQAELVNFVRRVPGGTVVVNRLDQLSPELLSVLVDGLGQGSLLDAPDGSGAVSTAGTAFLLTSKVPLDVFAHLDDEHRFKQDVHQAIVADFKSRAPNKRAAAILAEALQQRVSAVLPVGSDPAEYEAWQAAQAGGAAQADDGAEWETGDAGEAAEEEVAAVGADGAWEDAGDPVAEAVL